MKTLDIEYTGKLLGHLSELFDDANMIDNSDLTHAILSAGCDILSALEMVYVSEHGAMQFEKKTGKSMKDFLTVKAPFGENSYYEATFDYEDIHTKGIGETEADAKEVALFNAVKEENFELLMLKANEVINEEKKSKTEK